MRENAPRAVVVGAGIGGLAAAIGLRRGGWRVLALERSSRPHRRHGRSTPPPVERASSAPPSARSRSWDEIDLVFGLALGSLIGIGYALVNTLVHFLGDDVDRTRAANPWDSLTTDRTITLVRVVLVGLIAGLIVGIAVGNSCYRYSEFYTGNWEEAVNRGTNYGVLYGSYAALIRLLPSAWGTWLVHVRFWLPLTGRLPWRPKTFLHDAHERQVLRHAGPAYQFRHARLREHLAEQRRSRTNTTQSETRSGTSSSVTK